MRPSVLRRIRPVLDTQFGVITSAQLHEAGVDRRVARREGWLRLADGTWVVDQEPSDEQLLIAACLYAPDAVPTGPLACRWYGLRHAPRTAGLDAIAPVGVTLLGGPLIRVRQTRRPATGVEVRARAVAPLARSLADAVRFSTLRDGRAVLLAALADERLGTAALEKENGRGSAEGRARLTRVLGDWMTGARSAPEAEAADAVLAPPGAQAPLPFLLNPRLVHDGVTLGSPDGWIPSAGVGWEIDSAEFHGGADALDLTLRRHQRFADAGLQLLHVTPRRLREDRQAFARDVITRSYARLALGWRPPDGLSVIPIGPVLAAAAAA